MTGFSFCLTHVPINNRHCQPLLLIKLLGHVWIGFRRSPANIDLIVSQSPLLEAPAAKLATGDKWGLLEQRKAILDLNLRFTQTCACDQTELMAVSEQTKACTVSETMI